LPEKGVCEMIDKNFHKNSHPHNNQKLSLRDEKKEKGKKRAKLSV